MPRRGFGYGSIITCAQVKRQGADADDGIVNSIDNNNTECNEKEISVKPKIQGGLG